MWPDKRGTLMPRKKVFVCYNCQLVCLAVGIFSIIGYRVLTRVERGHHTVDVILALRLELHVRAYQTAED